MEYIDFQAKVFEVLMAINNALIEKAPKRMRGIKDLDELSAILRTAAEDLMLASDIPTEIARLSKRPRVLMALLTTAQATDLPTKIVLLKHAYASVPHGSDLLPFQPFCAFILKLCDRLEDPAPEPVTITVMP